MDYYNELRIAELIAAHILGTIDDDGKHALEQWKQRSGENRTLLAGLTGEKLERRMAGAEPDMESVIAEIHSRIAVRRRRSRRPVYRISAAACAVIAAVCLTVFIDRGEQPENTLLTEAAADPASKVRIILPSGEEIKLDQMSGSIEAGNGVINREGSDLVFTAAESASETATTASSEPVMTTIVTEQGGELSFRLGDGTSVWLNTDSEFSFPMEFGPDRRLVKLKGEAYFEVSHDPQHPFVVSAGEMDVQVLGTVFNVKSYDDDHDVSATLLSGVIEVDALGQTRRIEPGHAATIDRTTGKLTVAAADTFAATAWMHGQLIFNDEGIDAVLRTLARWYDVEFVYEGLQAGNYTFNGRMSRYDPLGESLNRITLAGGPSFVIDGGIIHVR